MVTRVGIAFSEHFKVDEAWMEAKGVFNPTLDVDAPLFIDPFLLSASRHKEFSDCGFETYEEHFADIYRSLRGSQATGDKAWKGALKKFQFSEARGMSGTCLGYSKRSTKGNAFGPILSKRALLWAKEVIELGVKDPELFSSMSLFEDNIGPDRISDMVTSITLSCILQFNNRILSEIKNELGVKIPTNPTTLQKLTANLPTNPYTNDGSPIILLAADVLKHLPILEDPRDLAKIASYNADLRDRVNEHISEIFKIRTKKEKDYIRDRAMESAAAFQTLLDLLKILEKQPYDLHADPQGLMQWRPIAHQFAGLYKLEIADDPKLGRLTRIDNVCVAIINQFQYLVEERRLSRTFHVNGKPRHERFAQMLFYAIAASYCDANDLDISPEADAGAGPVDFKFSDGSDKVVVEIKLSTNGKVVEGYKSQLDAYVKAERAGRGHYVVVDVGKIGKKWERLRDIARSNEKFARHKQLHLIDGNLRESASLLIKKELT